MADLSTIQTRQTRQDRVSDRKDRMIRRVDTEAPQRQIFADMRTARRGDAADELRQIFGGVERAAQGFADYMGKRQEARDNRDAAQGATDSLLGERNEELARKSQAYNVAYTKGTGERDTLSFAANLQKGVEGLLNDPEHQASPDDVDQFVHDNLAAFLRPDGQDRDFGSPEARALAYQHLRETTAKLRADAIDTIKKQVGETSLNNATSNISKKIELGLPFTYQDYASQVIDSVDPQTIQNGYLTTIQNSVEGLRSQYRQETDPKKAQEIANRMLAVIRMARGDLASTAPGADVLAEEQAIIAGDQPVTVGAQPAPAGKPMTRDQVINFTMMDLEGGDAVVHYSDADGGTTKYGIAAKFNPGVDVANLTQAQAAEITRKRYWFKELDSADPTVAAVAFDAGFIGGTSVGKRILAQANGDPSRALALYRGYLNSVADKNPDKEKYRRGWNNRVSRLAAKLGLTVGSGPVDIPIVSGAVPRPPSASDMAEQAPLDGSVAAVGGKLGVSQETLLRMNQYYESVVKSLGAESDAKQKAHWDAGANKLLGRFIGIGGSVPTVSEVQKMVMDGDLDPQVGYQTVQRIEQDAREERSEARAIAAETKQAFEQQQKERMDRRVNAFLAPVMAGSKSISQASAELLARSNAISDPDERNEFRRSIYGELQAIGQLRTDSAPYQQFMRDADTLGVELKGQIDRRILGPRRKKIETYIDSEIARMKVEGGRLGQDQGYDLPKYYDTIEQRMTQMFLRRGFNTLNPKI